MLKRARELTRVERLENVSYELGDAQVHRFDPGRFDQAISRFGTMFFSDPAAICGSCGGGHLRWLPLVQSGGELGCGRDARMAR